MILRLCAWCPRYAGRLGVLGVARWWPLWRVGITHGICGACKARLTAGRSAHKPAIKAVGR